MSYYVRVCCWEWPTGRTPAVGHERNPGTPRRLDGPHGPLWKVYGKRISLCLSGNRTPDRPARSVGATATLLFWLPFYMKAHFCIHDFVNRELVVSNEKCQSSASLWWTKRENCCCAFVGAFANLRKATISFIMSVSPSVHPLEKTRFPLKEFSWYLIFGCLKNMWGLN